jgi:hypothetical protein
MPLAVAMLPLVLASAQPTFGQVEREFDQWERRLRAKIAELHVLPVSTADDRPCDVTISFTVGTNGRPAEPTIRKSSCDPFYERVSRRLVGQLGRIGQVPSVDGSHGAIVLELSYGAAPSAALTEQLESERETTRRRNIKLVTGAGS